MDHNALSIIYNYTLKHKSSNENSHANGLSRVSLPNAPKNTQIPEDIVNFTETTEKERFNAQQKGRNWQRPSDGKG